MSQNTEKFSDFTKEEIKTYLINIGSLICKGKVYITLHREVNRNFNNIFY